MKVIMERSKLVKPIYAGKFPCTDETIPLSAFDKVTCNFHVAIVFAFRPPTPPNSDIERGLAPVLSEYRECAGRLIDDGGDGACTILLNDAGVRFVEASSDSAVDGAVDLSRPSKDLLRLHPDREGVKELMQIQLTRFACGTLVVGFTLHHFLADGNAASSFLVAWGRVTRGLAVEPLPLHDRSTLFAPRRPPLVEFEHRSAEFTTKKPATITSDDDFLMKNEIVFHNAHFTTEFLAKLKAKASAGGTRTYSTFQSLVSHLWRVVTKARALDGRCATYVRISVDGRARMNPPVPNHYFGNLVLWAFPKTTAGELIGRPLQHAAALIHDELTRMDDGYFRSFLDFASSGAADREGLVPSIGAPAGDYVLKRPNLEVHSWLMFPFYGVDFGGGRPFSLIPSCDAVEGLLILLPSSLGDGSIDVSVSLLSHDVSSFKQLCYLLD